MQVEHTRVHVNGLPANALEGDEDAVAARDIGSEPAVIRGGGDVTHSEARTGFPPAGSLSSGGVLQGLLIHLPLFWLVCDMTR